MSITVADNAEKARYEISVDGVLAGFTEYHFHQDVIAFIHTEIGAEFEGQGLASKLIGGALDDVRSRGLSVQPFCQFVRGFIKKRPEQYRDLVREEEWARFGLTD